MASPPRARVFAIRPSRAVASVVRGFARPTRDGRRVSRRRHRDQRACRRPLRADRGRGRARRWRRAPRHIRLAGADGTAAVARDPALHRHHAGDGRRRARAARGARGGRRAARAAGSWWPTRRASTARVLRARVRALRPRLAQAAGALHGPARAPLRAAVAAARAGAAGRLARDRGHRGPPRAARRAHLRARAVRPVPAAVRERGDDRRGAGGAQDAPPRPQDRARRARSRPSERPDLSTLPDDPGVYIFRDDRGAPALRGQVGVAAHRARGRTSARPRAGPSRPRSSTTGPPTRSWARSCSRTG